MINLDMAERIAKNAAEDNGDISAPEIDALARIALALIASLRERDALLRDALPFFDFEHDDDCKWCKIADRIRAILNEVST